MAPILPPAERPSEARIEKMNKNELKACVKTILANIDKASVIPENASDSAHFNDFTSKLNEVLTEVKESRAERIALSEKVKTLESDVRNLTEENTFLKSAISNQQRFLEFFDGDKRAHNLIITGLTEKDLVINENVKFDSDDKKLDYVFTTIDSDPACIDSIQRLGEVKPQATRPRPLKVTLKNKRDRRPVIENAKKLKNNTSISSVYIKKDIHPAFRKEMWRLYEAEKRERDRPENMGKTVIFDREERVLMVDDVIIDRYNPQLFG